MTASRYCVSENKVCLSGDEIDSDNRNFSFLWMFKQWNKKIKKVATRRYKSVISLLCYQIVERVICFGCTCLSDFEIKRYETRLDLPICLALNVMIQFCAIVSFWSSFCLGVGSSFVSLDSYTKELLLSCQYNTVLITAENLNLENVCYWSQVTAFGCVIDGWFYNWIFAGYLLVFIMLSFKCYDCMHLMLILTFFAI